MLVPKKRWQLKTLKKDMAIQLEEQLNIPPLLAQLLVTRGITEIAEAKKFLYEENIQLYDPFLLQDMEKAIERINVAIAQSEHILVYGDYDADGVTSTSVLVETLLQLEANVSYYIPNRFTEGYGPNEAAFRKAKADGVDLIITVDNGISGIREAIIARELEVDLIITDHHEPGPELPDAYAIIHPKLSPNYPFKELAGVGVAFKLAHALMGEVPHHLLDLVAIGTIADLVSLHDENRFLVKAGLKHLKNTYRIGLKELCKIADVQLQDITEETVGFAIAPRLNAIGRLEHAGPAVDLLLSNDALEARQLAERIDQINKERQALVSKITVEAFRMVEENFASDRVIIVGNEGWNAGVIGIVASKLVEKYYRPVIVLSFDVETGLAKGSARSIPGFDLFSALSLNSHLLPHFGGHPMAAGMTLTLEDVPLLRMRLNEIAEDTLTEEDYIPCIEVDAIVRLNEINIDVIEQLNLMGPYGTNNPKPIVMLEGLQAGDIRKIGANKNHLKMNFISEDRHLDGVGFHLGHLADEITPKAELSVLGELSINEWNNSRKPQVFIKDLQVDKWQLFDIRNIKQIHSYIKESAHKEALIICFSEETARTLSDFTSVLISNIQEAKELNIDHQEILLFDLPPNVSILQELIHGKSPARIYAHFHHVQEQFFMTIPNRDHFKWYYAFLLKRGTFDLNRYGAELAKYQGWTNETVQFMSQVFFDLNFVTIKDGIVMMNQEKQKKDLLDSPTYQNKLERIETEKVLLYSSYAELKHWFEERVALKEETKAWI